MMRSSKLPQGRSVEGHQTNDRKSESYERDIEHGRLLAAACYRPQRRKISISIRSVRHKVFVKSPSLAAISPQRPHRRAKLSPIQLIISMP
jgi:hypothetical protein